MSEQEKPRTITINIGGTDLAIPRDPGDPRPDHVITIAGTELNLQTGDITPEDADTSKVL